MQDFPQILERICYCLVDCTPTASLHMCQVHKIIIYYWTIQHSAFQPSHTTASAAWPSVRLYPGWETAAASPIEGSLLHQEMWYKYAFGAVTMKGLVLMCRELPVMCRGGATSGATTSCCSAWSLKLKEKHVVMLSVGFGTQASIWEYLPIHLIHHKQSTANN